ncbi:MAG: serine--tRNA ligase [archaeon]
MIDIKLIRDNPELVKANYKLRGKREFLDLLDATIKKDDEWRKLKFQADKLRSEKNKISQEVNLAVKSKNRKKIDETKEKAKEISQKLQETQEREKEIEKELRNLMLLLPNLIDKRVVVGKDDSENKEIRTWGVKPKIPNALSHVEIGKKLDGLDMETAAKITGSGFFILKGDLARLQRALIQFMLNYHYKTGRTEIISPVLANPKTAEGTAHLPNFDLDMYKTREGFYLIPTAEMTLTNLHRESVLNLSELPKRYYGHTVCFRTEAGRHGSETPGMFRLHQFDKVEMVTICKQEDNEKELQFMMKSAEELLQLLEVPYRVILICSGDQGFKESITYDIETWSPYLKKYMETSSVSSCTDFQARRMETYYHDEKNNKKLVYTLNGSGLALPRLMIALMENNQEKNGSIKIPKVLQDYMYGKKKIEIKK